MIKIKKRSWILYVGLFLYFFWCLVVAYNLSRGDTYVNFGFSYALSRGEIPYVDFNMVIPPVGPLLYSAFLIFSNSILCFYAGQALLLTIFFHFIRKLLDKKTWLYFVILAIPFPLAMVSILFPGYNFLLLFLLILILYCEKKQKSDLVIGILLGLAFMTKQTVGGLLIIPTVYYLFVDYHKVLKRIGGFLIPTGIICAILLVCGSFFEFVDLCFLGLFDFGHSNLYVDYFYLFVFLLCFVFLLIRIIKQPKRLDNYYVLLFSSCIFPIIDYYHVSLFLGAFFLLILQDISIKREVGKYCGLFAVSLTIIWFVVQTMYFKELKVVHYPNFEFSLVSANYDRVVQKLNHFVKQQDEDVVYFLRGSENYFYKIQHNLDITYFDLPNYGNYGYHGTAKLVKRIQKLEPGTLVVIDQECYQSKNPTQQYMKEAVSYIKEHASEVQRIGNYIIYQVEKR